MKSSAFESKPFQSRSKGEIPGLARRKERLSRSKLKQTFLIDDELFMYLIQLGSVHENFGVWTGPQMKPKGMEIVSARNQEVGGKELYEVPFSFFQYRECLKCLGYRVWRKHISMSITSSYYLFDQLFSTMAVPNHVFNLCSHTSWTSEK